MGRKRREGKWQWVADEDGGSVIEGPGRVARGPEKQRERENERLVKQLAKLPPSALASLNVDEDLIAQIERYARSGPGPERRRALSHAKGSLRHIDTEPLQAAVHGDTTPNRWSREAERWRARLLREGDAGLQAFVDTYADADRRRLRDLMRQAKGDPPNRAFRTLFQAIRTTVAEAPE